MIDITKVRQAFDEHLIWNKTCSANVRINGKEVTIRRRWNKYTLVCDDSRIKLDPVEHFSSRELLYVYDGKLFPIMYAAFVAAVDLTTKEI